jgi:NitT/TauT family transport system substrate-binding protein
MSRRLGRAAALALVGSVVMASAAMAADRIRLVAQRTGSLAWELDVIKAHGLDKKADLDIQTLELASTEAGKVALKGGSADIIVSDWTWVARERALGDALLYYPYLSTLGAVMVPAGSPIKDVADLKGKKLAVAGGPIDKSWLLLRALALRSGLDLRTAATVVYGAPPLLSQKALQGETDATLTFWNFCADLEAAGQKRAIDMDNVLHRLGASGPVAMLGYVFDGAWAAKNRAALDRFLDASRQAKDILASTPAEWQRLAPRIGVTDPAALAIYRAGYSEGIPRRPLGEEETDARALYRILADIGGAELVGPARELEAESFYRPAAGD